MSYDWKYELEAIIEEKLDDKFSGTVGYEFLSKNIDSDTEWNEIEKIKLVQNHVNMRLGWLYKSIKSVDENARLSTIEWYKENDEIDTKGMSDNDIEDIDGFWGSVDSDLTMYWEDIQDEYSEELKQIGEKRDERALMSAITSAQDEIYDIVEKLEKEIIPEAEKQVVREIFDEE